MYRPEYQRDWTQFDLAQANRLLDEIGLRERDDRGIRLLPDGRPLEIVVQTAGESTEQTDVLELIHDSWQKVGIKLYSVPSTREVFRNRIFSGDAIMSIWSGLENGIPTAATVRRRSRRRRSTSTSGRSGAAFTKPAGKSGEPPDLPEATELVQLIDQWAVAQTYAQREAIWHRMLDINRDQVYTIGIVNHVPHPVVVNNHLHNVPAKRILRYLAGRLLRYLQAGQLLVRRGQTLMLHYLVKRLLTMIPTLLIISMLVLSSSSCRPVITWKATSPSCRARAKPWTSKRSSFCESNTG